MRHIGFVVKKTDVGEYDQLIVLYTKEFGKIKAVAKSITKSESKQAAHLDTLNLVDFELIKGNGHPIITSSVSIKTHPNIKKNLRALAISSFLTEMIDKLIYDHDSDPNLWNFFVQFLGNLDFKILNGEPILYERLLVETQGKMMGLLGYYGDSFSKLEGILQKPFYALQFFKSVVKLEK